MRGKGIPFDIYKLFNRITPAYAGKSKAAVKNIFSVKDHPRVCGEKEFSYSSQSVVIGSPPRMRGKAL